MYTDRFKIIYNMIKLMKSCQLLKYALFASLLLFSGCLSVIEKTGRFIDGSMFAEKRVALYRTFKNDVNQAEMEISVVEKKGGAAKADTDIENGASSAQSIIITISKFPMIKFRGSYPDETGGFYLTSLEYLAGSTHGWNEYTLDLLGTGSLVLEETAVFQITEEIEPVQITAGRIQRYDTRLTGAEALAGLRNRRERVAALVEWMNALDAPKGQSIDDFEDHWKPILFPEMVSKKKRPADWQAEGDIFIRAEDIRWNTSYTERIFSEVLWPVRNSGTLLRDWEEALSWIYFEYEWENITELLSRKTNFYKN